ncbi:hypothetical protein ACIA6T_19035 [Streptomyces sp. NPDC051740]
MTSTPFATGHDAPGRHLADVVPGGSEAPAGSHADRPARTARRRSRTTPA